MGYEKLREKISIEVIKQTGVLRLFRLYHLFRTLYRELGITNRLIDKEDAVSLNNGYHKIVKKLQRLGYKDKEDILLDFQIYVK